jgi:hypothetical protein
MKIQLTPNTTTNIANSRSAYSSPPQRQGATVEQSVLDLIESEKNKNPGLAEEFASVLEGMKEAPKDLTIEAEKTKNVWNFSISPRNSKSPGNSKYSYILGAGGQKILEMFDSMLKDLRSI